MRIVTLSLLSWFCGSIALAQPVEVASGSDLAAWQSLEQRRLDGQDAITAYQAYVLTYSASPLAVVAWDRLVSFEGTEGAWAQPVAVRGLLAQVRRQWEIHQRALRDDVAQGLDVVTVETVDELPAADAVAVTKR